ncbi:MAG: hypothetical protein ACRD1Y_07215 [Terriglobales bacterium]
MTTDDRIAARAARHAALTRQLGHALSPSGRPLPANEARLQPDQREGVPNTEWPGHRPAHLDADTLHTWVRALGLPALIDLGEEAAPILDELVASLRVVELWVWRQPLRYCAADLLPFVYVAVGDRHPEKDFRRQAQRGTLSRLAAEAYEQLLVSPSALTATRLRDLLGAARISRLAVDRSLFELAQTLKIVRCGRNEGETEWRPLLAALPDVPGAVDHIAQSQAAAALLTQYLDVNVCATEPELADWFSPLFSRTLIHSALKALAAARQLTPDALDGHPAWRLP